MFEEIFARISYFGGLMGFVYFLLKIIGIEADQREMRKLKARIEKLEAK